MDYMTSSSSSNGSYSLTVQFNQGTDADMDTVNTQNRVQAALSITCRGTSSWCYNY